MTQGIDSGSSFPLGATVAAGGVNFSLYSKHASAIDLLFFDAVDATIQRVLDFPRAGATVPRVPRNLPIRRLAVTRFPYHVIYLEPTTELRILAVAHDRRKPGYWRHRIK